MSGAEVYEHAVRYLIANGWRRQERVSGWWWKEEAGDDATLGGALEWQLDTDGVDQRVAVDDEPEEYWGP